MAKPDSPASFGCESCWPPSADAAWMARQTLTFESELIHESHFHVAVRACSTCAQQFVSVFTETIDWRDGDDPQCWVVLPLTAQEAASLVQKGDAMTEGDLAALDSGRKCLRRDYGKGEAPRCHWDTGLHVRPHD